MVPHVCILIDSVLWSGAFISLLSYDGLHLIIFFVVSRRSNTQQLQSVPFVRHQCETTAAPHRAEHATSDEDRQTFVGGNTLADAKLL